LEATYYQDSDTNAARLTDIPKGSIRTLGGYLKLYMFGAVGRGVGRLTVSSRKTSLFTHDKVTFGGAGGIVGGTFQIDFALASKNRLGPYSQTKNGAQAKSPGL